MSRQIDWQTLTRVLEAVPKIASAWVFGSARDGRICSGGDVDVAVWVDEPLTVDEKLDVMGELQKTLRLNEIDLVFLNDANSILRFEAVSGRLLFCRDRQQMAACVSLVAREYEDEMAQWQRALQ